jgi:lipopolysaccharide transport system permease protein
MVSFSVVCGRLAGLPSDGRPYPVFSLAALVPWTYFATALASGSQSVVANQHVIAKVYFPRLLIPLASVLGPLVDFAIAFAILMVMVFAYGIPITARVLWIAPLVGLAILTAAAASVWLAALNVRYRDIRYITPFLIQVWMFATPVPYSASIVPERWRALYGLNPMAGVVEGFRWALIDGRSPGMMTLVSATVVALGLAGGMMYFRSVEGSFADLI